MTLIDREERILRRRLLLGRVEGVLKHSADRWLDALHAQDAAIYFGAVDQPQDVAGRALAYDLDLLAAELRAMGALP